jgi:4-hydroxy-tetrahydrodipicolinate synthase
MKKLKGTGVALITPFTKKGKVDFIGLEAMVNHVIADGKGVDYIVALGTTGETATLDWQERMDVFACITEKNKKRVPLVAGFGGNDTAKLIQEIKAFNVKGYDAILSASPYYNKPTQEGIYQHYKAVCSETNLPVITYNVPGRTASNITAATCIRLAKDIKNIVAVKEASGDLIQCMEIVRDKPKDFLVISGEDALTLPMISFGMDGVISVAANVWPVEFSRMVKLAMKGDFVKASNIHFKLLAGMHLLFAEGNPGGAKAFLSQMGIIENCLRLPLVPVSKELEAKMRAFTKQLH